MKNRIYGFPGIPGGNPWIPWGDRWDLGTDGTWASRTPDTSSEDTSSELFIDIRNGRPSPARPGLGKAPGASKTATEHSQIAENWLP